MTAPRRGLSDAAEGLRTAATGGLEGERRAALGQYLTPAPVASLIASMVRTSAEHVRLLEPGAGTGSLIAATVEELCGRARPPRSIGVTAYEIDTALAGCLPRTFELCRAACEAAGIDFEARLVQADFIRDAVERLRPADLLPGSRAARYNLVVTNPPYRKLNSGSMHRALLRSVGIETTNLYAAFVALSTLLLEDGGELVAITPRSFCNGTYFRPFRRLLLGELAIRRVHLFESRKAAFKEDAVLQENIIFHGIRGAAPAEVEVTAGNGRREAVTSLRTVRYPQLVLPGDPERVIHLVPSEEGQTVADAMRRFSHGLEDLGLSVSTGRVVDFRARDQLRESMGPTTAPLIYPTHLSSGRVVWPKPGKKPNALHVDDHTRPQLVPNETYVLVKRFSAKEERRRVVAVVYDGSRIAAPDGVAFENHLNYFHHRGRGVDLPLARGLAGFLNSTLVDLFFRQFSGHTQVNAGDLRMLPYPGPLELRRFGEVVGDAVPDQGELDRLVETHLCAGVVP